MMDIVVTLVFKFLSFSAVASGLIYFYFKWKYQYWEKKNVPCLEPSFPFGNVGNVFNVQRDEIIAEIYHTVKSKGWKYCGLYMVLSPTILIVDTDLAKRVLVTDFQYFTDRGMYTNEKNDPSGCNLFTLSGKKWRVLRTKLTPTFSSGKLKSMFETLLECGLTLENHIENEVDVTRPAEIKSIMHCYSTDVIGSCAFGVDCNSFKDPNSLFRRATNDFFVATKLDYVLWLFKDNFPGLSRALGLRQVKKRIGDFFKDMVHKTVAYREENDFVRNDFMQMLIDLKNGKNVSIDKQTGSTLAAITMDEVIGHTFIFFIAGSESSSSSLTFALFELALKQDVQDRLRAEIYDVLTRYDNEATYDALLEMKYMGQVIDETLRLHSPSRIVERKCVMDYKVPGEDVIIDKGTVVYLSAKGVHYDEEFWPNAKEFDPERFTEENRKHMNPCAFLPFGYGHRGCVGERFGRMQIKIGLISVLKKFKVSLNKKTQLPLKISVNGLFCNVEGDIWLDLEKIK